MDVILASPLLKFVQASPRGERPARRRKTVEAFTYGKIGETGNERAGAMPGRGSGPGKLATAQAMEVEAVVGKRKGKARRGSYCH